MKFATYRRRKRFKKKDAVKEKEDMFKRQMTTAALGPAAMHQAAAVAAAAAAAAVGSHPHAHHYSHDYYEYHHHIAATASPSPSALATASAASAKPIPLSKKEAKDSLKSEPLDAAAAPHPQNFDGWDEGQESTPPPYNNASSSSPINLQTEKSTTVGNSLNSAAIPSSAASEQLAAAYETSSTAYENGMAQHLHSSAHHYPHAALDSQYNNNSFSVNSLMTAVQAAQAAAAAAAATASSEQSREGSPPTNPSALPAPSQDDYHRWHSSYGVSHDSHKQETGGYPTPHLYQHHHGDHGRDFRWYSAQASSNVHPPLTSPPGGSPTNNPATADPPSAAAGYRNTGYYSDHKSGSSPPSYSMQEPRPIYNY